MSEFKQHTEPPTMQEVFDVLELVIAAQFGVEVSEAKKRALLMSRRLRAGGEPSLVYGPSP